MTLLKLASARTFAPQTPPQLPPLLLRPAHVRRRDVDAEHRARVGRRRSSHRTRAASRSASLAICRFGPFTLLGLVAGVVTDRFDNRRTVIVTQSVQMVFSAVLAVITLAGHVTAVGDLRDRRAHRHRARLRRAVAAEPDVPDGRPRRAAERDRAQLEPLQHRADLRAGARRRPDRRVRRRLVLRDQLGQLPRRAREPARDAGRRAVPARSTADARRSGAERAKASATRAATGPSG